MKKIKVKYFDEFLISFFVILILILLSLLDLGRVGTVFLIPLASWYFFFSRKGRAKYVFNIKAIKWYLFFIVLTCLSIFYAIDPLVAISTQLKLLVVFLFSITIFSFCLESLRNVSVLYFTNAFILFSLFIYLYSTGVELDSGTRVNSENFDPNTYGYFIFGGIHSLFSLYNIVKGKKKVFLIGILIVIASLLSFWVALVSASRGTLFISFFLIIGNIFIIFNVNKKGLLSKFIFLIISFIFFFYAIKYSYDNHFEFSLVEQRFAQLEDTESTREFHLRKAIEIGFENPILGVGAGNYAIVPKSTEQGVFSHNSFVEVFANHGIFVFLVFMIFLLSIFSRLRRLFKIKHAKMNISFYQISLFLILFLVYSTLYIFYLSTIFLHLLFVIYAHMIILERSIYQNNNIK